MTGFADLSSLVGAYLAEQCSVIIGATAALREKETVVHPTRVAVRRLRSTLRSYAPLFDPEPAAALETELVWWAGLLGTVRDMEVLEARLEGQLAELPPELVVGPVARQIQSEIEARREHGWRGILSALDETRYADLVAELGRWQSDPPFTDRAQVPAAKVGKYVKKATTVLDLRLRRAMIAYDDHDHGADELFHSARKAGKRARYAAELSGPLWQERATQLIADHKSLQDVLGEHQDSVVSAEFLRELGVRMGIRSGHNGFTYGLLYARERARSAAVGDRLKPFLS